MCLLLFAMTGLVRIFIPAYGQSLSLGNVGCPAISTTQPYLNKRLNVGSTAFVALIEDGACSGGVGTGQESLNSSAANNLTLLDPAHLFQTIWNNFGQAGTAISGLQSGTGPYTNFINGVTAANNLAVAAGDTLVVPAFVFTEGESDNHAASTTFYADSITLRNSLDAAVKGITGQTQNVRMVFSQLSSNESDPSGGNLLTCPDTTVACLDDPKGIASSMTTMAQWQLQRDFPTLFYLTGPKYQYTYGDGGFHMDAVSYNQLGATTSRILKTLLIDGTNDYAGVFPGTISRSGTTVTVVARTPRGLALTSDTTTVPNPYRNGAYDTNGLGFQFFCNNAGTVTEIAFTAAIISSSQTVTLTLASTPSCSTSEHVAYAFEGQRFAYTPVAGCAPDATTCTILGVSGSVFPNRGTAHGNIRTVADYTDVHGDPVYHWMVHFNEPVGFSWAPFSTTATKFLISQ